MNPEQTQIESAIAALESQRATLGDAVLELAIAPLRARLAAWQRPAGLQQRQVTVLFADVVGSTAMAGGMQVEDALDVVGGTLRCMAEIVEAHHGRVLRFTGDGVKAAFGMMEAREDDAERAVRAGLAILKAGLEAAVQARRQYAVDDFAVRVGVHTGDVALGAGIDADKTAVGLAVNVAARMEQSAPPGALRISHDTWNQVRGLFEVEAQPPLHVKGIDAPMKTYLVRAALERSVASVERGLQGLATPMVGRDAELQRLLELVAQARQTRQLQALTLLGDAGLGKSRLLRELRAALNAEASATATPTPTPTPSVALARLRLLALRSQPDGMLRPWGLLRSLLATQFSVADTDSAEDARRKVVEGLGPWFDERGERQAQLIGQLSGLDFADSLRGLDPRSLRDQAFAAIRTWLQAMGRKGALPLLLVEDLHWADDGSLDLLQHLLAHAAELPLVLVMTARPTLQERRPDWCVPETSIQLSPLAAAHSDELVLALLRRIDPLPARLTGLIVGRAEGNPYYMEELVRRLIDDGVIVVDGPNWTVEVDRLDSVRLPGTLVGLLQARLDALPAGERQAARQASIVGHVFWDDALRALDASAPQALPALQRAGFVHEHDSSDFEGTAEHRFDHHLLHQVTYDTLLKAERRRGHGAAARWLRARTQGRGAEFLAMMGEHAERAGETALAIDCFEQAGKDAQQRFANAAAQSWLRRALALLAESEPLRRVDMLHKLQHVAEVMGDWSTQDALLAEAGTLLDDHPDDTRLALHLYRQARLADRRGEAAAAERLARQAVEVAERCGAAQSAAEAQGRLAWLHSQRLDHVGARTHVELGLLWAGRMEDQNSRDEVLAGLQVVSALNLTDLCRFDEANDAFMTVLARGEALSLPQVQVNAMAGLICIADDLGRHEQMASLAERMLTLARSMGWTQRVAAALFFLGEAAAQRGDAAAAITWYGQSLSVARVADERLGEAMALHGLGEMHGAEGDANAALLTHTQAQDVYQGLEPSLATDENMACVALCQALLDQPAAALSTLRPVLERLGDEWAQEDPHATITLRWNCQRVLGAVADPRAAPMLQQLHADVQARVAVMTDADDRERLLQALPVFRGVVAAFGRRTGGTASSDRF